MINPYIAGAPVTEARMFFGREDVFEWIERSLTGRYADHILVIHGQRRVGKTSVLKQLANRLPPSYIPVFFDLQGRTHTTLDRFLWWLAREVVRALRLTRNIAVPLPDREAFSADPDRLELRFLPDLRPHLGDDRLLLAFDEFDALEEAGARQQLARPLVDYLRRLMGRDDLNFVFSIGSSGRKLENMQASYTEFFKAALYKKITFLGPEDTYRLVTEPAQGLLRYDRKAVDRIYALSSGHPYFTQLVCHELFSQCQKTGRKRVREADVDAVLDDVVERGTVNLKFVWDEASEQEKWVLASLAHLQDAADVHALVRFLRQEPVRISEEDLELALLHLREKDVLTSEHRFVIHLMQVWLEKNRPMERVREELIEINPIANRYIEIGQEYRDRGLHEKAIDSFQEALRVDEENVRAHVGMGAVHLGQEAFGEALAEFERALQLDEDHVAARAGLCDAHLALGDQALASGTSADAIRSYQQVLGINAEHTEARQRLADIYRASAEQALGKGLHEKALGDLEEALAFTPEDVDLATRCAKVRDQWRAAVIAGLLARADEEQFAGRWSEAIAVLKEALQQEPDDEHVQEKLKSVEEVWRASRLQAILDRAEQARRSQRWDEAVEALQEYVDQEPSDASVQHQLIEVQRLRREGQLKALREQAQSHAEAEEWEQALAAWREYLALEPDDGEAAQAELAELERLRSLALAYSDARSALVHKDYDRAIGLLKGLVIQDETYKDASRLLADAIEARRKGEPAVRRTWLLGAAAVVVVVAVALALSSPSSPLRVAMTRPTATIEPAAPSTVAPTAGPESTESASQLLTPLPTQTAAAAGVPTAAPAAPTNTVPVTKSPTPVPLEPVAGATMILEPAGVTFVYVPAGEFVRGSQYGDEDADDDERPQRTVYLDGYWIGRTEVTNAQYARFIEAGGYTKRDSWTEEGWAWKEQANVAEPRFWRQEERDQPDYPVVGVSWYEATAYAEWAGGRLPTEAEWEKAARGTDGRIYPWGDTWDGSRYSHGLTAPAGSYPSGASPYGALDMTGNVWEWCWDRYDDRYYAWYNPNNPSGPGHGDSRVLRGGSYQNEPSLMRCANRYWFAPDQDMFNWGFRLAASPSITEPEPQGGHYVVVSAADSGPGSLRQALMDAPAGATITFDPANFPAGDPSTIFLASELPPLDLGQQTIDASNAGVILDGSSISSMTAYALQLYSDGNTIQGLQIVNFAAGGIAVAAQAQHNTIGGDRNIGAGPSGQANWIGDCDFGIGIWDEGTSLNTITGNLIGTDSEGDADRGNNNGIQILEGAHDNTIGPGNVIAHNHTGIVIWDPSSLGNTVTQNSIHSNYGADISLQDGGNGELAAPVLTAWRVDEGAVEGTACLNCTIEVFSADGDGGEIYEGQTTANSSGAFALDRGIAFKGPNVSATATDIDGNTSPFSAPVSGTSEATVPLDEPSAGATMVLEPAGITMVYVPAGEFVMGSSGADALADDDEKPQHSVYLDGYWIGQTEVTNAQYAQFIEAGGYAQREVWGQGEWADWDWVERTGLSAPYYWEDERYNQPDQPVVGVSWHEATAFAAWAGARLPTEAEWEKAARGTDGRIYPWGDAWDGTLCNACDTNCWGGDSADETVDDGYGGPAPVGSYPSGASPYGALDMAGNVWEWCSTWYDAEYYAHSPGANPQGPDAAGGYRVLRGGAYNRLAAHARSTNRNWNWGDTLNSPNAGFRIVVSAVAP